ncbi:MAG: hypothetical protein OWU84_13095 [Firmicutes bacterium]|nr:hypothetical protein [Bacillota bacterium]
MAKLYLTMSEELPAPVRDADLAIWWPSRTVSAEEVRSWAGWSGTYLLARGDPDVWHAYRPNLSEWPSVALVVGQGRVWRFEKRYLAVIDPDTLMIPEVSRALALAGVAILISYGHDGPSPFLHPLWRAAQANQIFALRIGPEPRWYLPCEVDPAEEGVQPCRPEPGGWTVDFDFAQLGDARRRFPIQQGLRPSLYKSQAWWPHG